MNFCADWVCVVKEEMDGSCLLDGDWRVGSRLLVRFMVDIEEII
jgi:hypothetical protein